MRRYEKMAEERKRRENQHELELTVKKPQEVAATAGTKTKHIKPARFRE